MAQPNCAFGYCNCILDLLVLDGAPRRDRALCSDALCKNHTSLSGKSSFTSPFILQGLPGVPGEQGVPGPAGVQVRGTLKKIFYMSRVECPQGLYNCK